MIDPAILWGLYLLFVGLLAVLGWAGVYRSAPATPPPDHAGYLESRREGDSTP